MAEISFTRQIIDVYDQLKDNMPTKFLCGFFRKETHASLEVETHMRYNEERISEDVIEGGIKNVDLGQHDIERLQPLNYHEQASVNHNSLFTQTIGQHPYETREQTTVAMEKIMEAQMDCMRAIQRAEEKQASDVMFKGSINPAAEQRATINYGRHADHTVTLTGTELWDSTAAQPVQNLIDWSHRIRTRGKIQPSMVIMGTKAFNALERDADIKAQLDQRHREDNVVNIAYKRAMDSGATYRGMITVGTYQLAIYLYQEIYYDPSDSTNKQYVPDNMICILPEQPHWVCAHGAVLAMRPIDSFYSRILGNQTSLPQMMKTDYYLGARVDEESTTIRGFVKSRNLYIPTAVNQCLAATVTSA